MGGGLLQLVAYGAQDVYLTGNPQITFWKVSYRRYTNFSMESIQQSLTGTPRLGQRCTCQISRNGDLIHKMYLEINTTTGVADNLADGGAFIFIDKVEVEIGGQMIDRHYGNWMYIWNKLSLSPSKFGGFNRMTRCNANDIVTGENTIGVKMTVPFEFWFCRNPGLALPLIALQYHEVKLNIFFNESSKLDSGPETMDDGRVLGGANTFNIASAIVWVDYIFLDTDERRRMAQNPHEYLIDQVQLNNFTFNLNAGLNVFNCDLTFNHPVKELIWAANRSQIPSKQRFTDFLDGDVFDGLTTRVLQLNGQDRFEKRDGAYFRITQPYQHHTNVPVGFDFSLNGTFSSGINCYSFSLRPEEHQPSGTCNFSRIDSARLQTEVIQNAAMAGLNLLIYAVNYNVLRIMSGMGGLAYSN